MPTLVDQPLYIDWEHYSNYLHFDNNFDGKESSTLNLSHIIRMNSKPLSGRHSLGHTKMLAKSFQQNDILI